ncbi:hypothetical protein BC941DRAFT_440130 [Chlamydoabsidia padenii]|nr:hypothetical protein BC941DRAFT_440130 [Chlamydoabsidia padenii]
MSECAICLCSLHSIESRDSISALHCGHIFHTNCVSPWVATTHSCPTCKHKFKKDSNLVIKLYLDLDTITTSLLNPDERAMIDIERKTKAQEKTIQQLTHINNKLNEDMDKLKQDLDQHKRTINKYKGIKDVNETVERLRSIDYQEKMRQWSQLSRSSCINMMGSLFYKINVLHQKLEDKNLMLHQKNQLLKKKTEHLEILRNRTEHLELLRIRTEKKQPKEPSIPLLDMRRHPTKRKRSPTMDIIHRNFDDKQLNKENYGSTTEDEDGDEDDQLITSSGKSSQHTSKNNGRRQQVLISDDDDDDDDDDFYSQPTHLNVISPVHRTTTTTRKYPIRIIDSGDDEEY